jgi:hypothetical protein
MTKFKMERNWVPVGFTIRLTEPDTVTMQVAELLPHREAIDDFIATERAYHAKHRAQARCVLDAPGHEDASEAARMIQLADRFISELDDLAAAFRTPYAGSEFQISSVILSKMFEALNRRTDTAA